MADIDIKVGDRVCLRHGTGFSGLGMINSFMLQEEGYQGSADVIAVDEAGATVRLPSGYEFRIGDRDIFKVLEQEGKGND